MPEQLIFDWPAGTALRPEDFFVSDANRNAADMVMAPDTWPEGKLVIIGPKAAGKSHLARVFQARFGGVLARSTDLPTRAPEDRPLIIEDADRLPQASEERLFHLHNAQINAGGKLLLTARSAPARWSIALPDLASRMQATTPVAIDDPDDTLFQVLLAKLFADRQVIPAPAVISYITKRAERSYSAAGQIVEALDREALTQKKPASLKMAGALLDKMQTSGR